MILVLLPVVGPEGNACGSAPIPDPERKKGNLCQRLSTEGALRGVIATAGGIVTAIILATQNQLPESASDNRQSKADVQGLMGERFFADSGLKACNYSFHFEIL